MNSLALLIALGATSGMSSCAGGSCATPAYTYSYAAPAACVGASCGTTYGSYYYAPQAQAPAPAPVAYTAPAAPQPVYAPAPAPVAYAPQAAPAPTYYYSAYVAPMASGCANGQCYRR